MDLSCADVDVASIALEPVAQLISKVIDIALWGWYAHS